MNVTSRQLKAFVLTARHQSFSRAAEQLSITPSGMSVLMRELEAQLGFRLFERTTRKVVLTELGSRFLPIVDRSLRELEAAAANLSRSAAAASERIAIGAAPFPAAEIMPQAISAYAVLNPRVRIELVDAERACLIELLQTGKIDAALITGVREEPPGLTRMPLARFALMLICPARGRRELPLEVPWSEIVGLRLIGLPGDSPIQQLVDEHLVRAGRTTPAEVTCNFIETQLALVESGTGAAIMPTSVASACVKRNVTMHALVEPVAWAEFCWLSSRSRELSPCAEDFGEFLKDYLAHIPADAPLAGVRAA